MSTSSPKSPQTWLTHEAADRLRAELADLQGPRRADIIKKIEAARSEGDLKENGGYHAAKDEQGKIEARIRQLTQMLEAALNDPIACRERVAVAGDVGVGGHRERLSARQRSSKALIGISGEIFEVGEVFLERRKAAR